MKQEKQELESRRHKLDALKLQIDKGEVSASNQTIDYEMIDRYDDERGSLNSAYTAHQVHVDYYQQQVQARKNYLLTHCTSSR